ALMAGAATDRWFSTDEWDKGRWLSLLLFSVVAFLMAMLASPMALAQLRADAAGKIGPDLAERVGYMWTQAWNATGIGFIPAVRILLAAGGTISAVWKKLPLGVLAGLVACAVAGGVSYCAAVLPSQSWVLSSEAALSALKELCALPEGTAIARA